MPGRDMVSLQATPQPRLARLTGRQPSVAPVAIARQAKAGKLPACGSRKEIPVARPNVRAWRDSGPAAQHVLVAHEFAVVLADRTRRRPVARVRGVVALGP